MLERSCLRQAAQLVNQKFKLLKWQIADPISLAIQNHVQKESKWIPQPVPASPMPTFPKVQSTRKFLESSPAHQTPSPKSTTHFPTPPHRSLLPSLTNPVL